jgi:hypothetical protein
MAQSRRATVTKGKRMQFALPLQHHLNVDQRPALRHTPQ